ncbi:MAG: helix-hairpin-helix domain-containing protein [Flavobacteriaceae bacterium]|nr:helix-hairpin-helix domain-containing protein [Flavobacteriaceae bacterium]
MSIFRKTHFWYNKSQRNGIFFLLLIIIGLQLGYFFIDFTGKKGISATEKEWFYLEKETDSLQKLTKKTVRIYPFNPNSITDFKGYSLGMSTIELDRLYRFRKQGKYVNSAKEFQRVTKISDTLLSKIQGYFKFPKWTTKKQVVFTPKKAVSIRDINKVNASDLRIVKGIGEKLAQRIITYREKLQGFSYNNQLYEVWGLDRNVADEVLKKFVVMQKPIIKKININTATFKEVLRIVYIDYQLCKKIFNYRDEVAELQSIEELKNIEGFPLGQFEKIILYLDAK